MRKTIFTLFLFAVTLGLTAQERTAIVESGSVALYPENGGESFSVNIAGLVLNFGEAKSSSRSEGAARTTTTGGTRVSKREASLYISPTFDFGFNYLLSPDYSIYRDPLSSRGTEEFLDLNTGKSIHFGWSPVIVRASFNRSNTLGITSGLTLVWRGYAFSNRNMTVAKENGMLVPVPIEGNFKKSKLTVFSLRVPVLLTITEPQSKIGVGLGGYVDFVTRSHTKYKSPRHKEREDYYVEPVQFGLQARIRYQTIGVFANYGLGDMFREGKAPATRPLTIGVGFGF